MVLYKHKQHDWIVEIISQTLTHNYIKYLHNGHRTNVTKDYFKKYFIITKTSVEKD